MNILGIETSCDETAASVVKNGHEILSNVIVSQIDIHKKYGGVVPEIASRNHLLKINGVIKKAVDDAGITINDIHKIAVTAGPGLIGALLTGLSSAKAISYITSKPLIPVNHIHGHLYSAYMGRDLDKVFPSLALLVSGGHTSILLLKSIKDITLIANTRDDAAGEAFDKVAQFMGLGYPGGPSISKAAEMGRWNAIPLPLPLAAKKVMAFSFSGLKTAVMNYLKNNPKVNTNDMCASFEHAACMHLLNKFEICLKKYKPVTASLCGGVSANTRLRQYFQDTCKKHQTQPIIPPLNLCTDNAAMIAGIAYHLDSKDDYLELNSFSSSDLNNFNNGPSKSQNISTGV